MKENSLPKEYRLLNKNDFAGLRSRDSKKMFFKTFKLISLKNEQGHGRLGFAVSRKVGKANVRNLLKRKLREWFRQSSIRHKSYDLMIIVHPKWKSFGEEAFLLELEADLKSLLVKF